MVQVLKEHYDFSKYTDIPRWLSYWHQIDETLKLEPRSVLVIGIGDGAVMRLLKDYVTDIKTFDIDPELNPSFLGNISEIDQIVTNKFDVILCCQVLEHIPFELFNKILANLSQLSRHMVIFLPYCHHNIINIIIGLPKLKLKSFQLSIPKFYKGWKFNSEHYWEMGTSGYPVSLIRNNLEKEFNITNSFTAKINPYHKFDMNM